MGMEQMFVPWRIVAEQGWDDCLLLSVEEQNNVQPYDSVYRKTRRRTTNTRSLAEVWNLQIACSSLQTLPLKSNGTSLLSSLVYGGAQENGHCAMFLAVV